MLFKFLLLGTPSIGTDVKVWSTSKNQLIARFIQREKLLQTFPRTTQLSLVISSPLHCYFFMLLKEIKLFKPVHTPCTLLGVVTNAHFSQGPMSWSVASNC